MSIQLIDRGIMNTTRQGYTLNTNPLAGFKTAVNNGQTRLALEYAEVLLDELISRIASLEGQLNAEPTKASQEKDTLEAKDKSPRQRKQTAEKDTTE